ncbi:MAG: hypothetical protein WDZ83_17730 [Rhizobiaceae bacterium]
MELTSTFARRIIGSVMALALPFAAGPVAAQDEPVLAMDLNGLTQTDAGCRFTFVIENMLPGDLNKAIFEFVLFGADGLVERLLTLDFKELPKGKTRVRQFDLADLQCTALARILVNDASECSGEGTDPAACMRDLKTSTATELQFGS